MPRQGGGPFVGTTGLDGSTLTALLRDVVREVARHGVRRILVLDGHFENQMFTIEAINLVRAAAGQMSCKKDGFLTLVAMSCAGHA